MITTVIFDIDGTLIDTEKAVLKGLQNLLKTDYGKSYSLEQLEFVFGLPGSDSLPQLGVDNVEEAYGRWNHFFMQYFDLVTVFDGIKETLQALKAAEIATGIVTSKTKAEFVNDFLPFGLDHFFDVIVCADDTEKHKPHPDPMLQFLKMSGSLPEQSVYVGDTLYDCQCAQTAGVRFCLAGWGSRHPELITPDFVLHTPDDMIRFIKEDFNS